MDEPSGPESASSIYSQLRRLATENGIWRANLGELLDNDLHDLRDCWNIDTSQAPGAIWESVGRTLLGYLRQILANEWQKKSDRKRRQFENTFRYVFNIFNADSGLLDVRLTKAGVSKSTAQRNQRYICASIENLILATGFVPSATPVVVESLAEDPLDAAVVVDARDAPVATKDLAIIPYREALVRRLPPWTPPPVSVGRRLWHLVVRHKIVAIVVIVVLLASGLTVPQLLSDPPAQESRLTENPLGNALSVDLQGIGSYHSLFDITYDDKHQGDGQRMLALAESGGITPAAYDDALESGAHLVGGATLIMKLSTKRPGQLVELYKVRVIKKVVPLATYATFRGVGLDWLPQDSYRIEAFPEEAGILLDAGTDAHEVDSSKNLLGPYLQRRRVPVNDLASPQLILDVQARERAYEFQVELEYSLDGQIFSQLVDLSGQPFRASADLCLTQELRYKLPAPTIDALSSRRYTVVALPDRRAGATPGTYTTETPDVFAETCRRR